MTITAKELLEALARAEEAEADAMSAAAKIAQAEAKVRQAKDDYDNARYLADEIRAEYENMKRRVQEED